jgi:hypothetical protein
LLGQEGFMFQQGFKVKPQSLVSKIARKSRLSNSDLTPLPIAKTSRPSLVKVKFKLRPRLKL